MRNLFKRKLTKQHPELLLRAVDEITNELILAKSRQRPGAEKPSGYMKGLQKAIDIIDELYKEESIRE